MKKIFLLMFAAGMMALTSCDLDINENPNYPLESTITTDLMFPAVENAVADVVGDQMFNYAGFFAQYFEQGPTANQYNDLAELNIDEGSDLFNRCYSLLYAGALTDIQDIMGKTDNKSDIFACTVMRAQAFQLVVDNLSDAPYTEALQGASGNAMPIWDDGKTVYEGVLKELDDAEDELEGDPITMTDPLLNKNLNQWKGYANALRLRMYMRLIDGGINAADYTAKAKNLVADNEFFSGDVCWNVYSNAVGQYNPWYDGFISLSGTKNHCAAYPITSYMNLTNDPRLAYAFNKSVKNDEYDGQIPGAKTTTGDWMGISSSYNTDYVSVVNYPITTAMPIYLFTQSELQFLIAEVELRFNNNDGAAMAAYEAAIKADFESKLADLDPTDFLSGPRIAWTGSKDEKLKKIYMQKWVAFLMRNHMEAWSEIRRTDVPALSPSTAKQIFDDPTETYNAGDMINPAVNHINGGGLAKRVPYPSSARTLNNNTPPAKLLSDRVFWDAK
ncbi:MAG: SusD/RagB family nutrient-binding outer membrane lipoprotein [Muribaculaceae bacterium]|nr:SusD/RagB family nutrient-binding outer membrane lipoprotein [Muribaculaceae bacterium]